MSIKVEIKGIIIKVGTPIKTKRENYYQELLIEKPAYRDEFGDVKGSPDFYRVVKFRQNLTDFESHEQLLNKKVRATVYLNGREFTTHKGTEYITNLNVKELELIQ